MKGKRLLLAAVAVLAAAALAGGIAWAAIPGSGNVYTACMLKNLGTVRLIDKTLPSANLMSHCTSLETELSWNQTGQQGPPGAQGAAGPAGTVSSLDALEGLPCDHGNGQTHVNYAANGSVSLRCAGPTLTVTFGIGGNPDPFDFGANVDGSIRSDPAGIDCSWVFGAGASGTCSYQFLHGTTVTLTADGGGGQQPWTGCDAVTQPATVPGAALERSTCTLTMNADRAVSTHWSQ